MSGLAEDFLRNAPFTLRRAGEVLEKGGIRLQMEEYLDLLPHRHGTDGFFAAVLERVALMQEPGLSWHDRYIFREKYHVAERNLLRISWFAKT